MSTINTPMIVIEEQGPTRTRNGGNNLGLSSNVTPQAKNSFLELKHDYKSYMNKSKMSLNAIQRKDAG